jgi:hypothetical protein
MFRELLGYSCFFLFVSLFVCLFVFFCVLLVCLFFFCFFFCLHSEDAADGGKDHGGRVECERRARNPRPGGKASQRWRHKEGEGEDAEAAVDVHQVAEEGDDDGDDEAKHHDGRRHQRPTPNLVPRISINKK